jgi:hypothetical protein
VKPNRLILAAIWRSCLGEWVRALLLQAVSYRNKFDPAVPLLQLTTRLAHRVGRSVVLPIDALKKAR